MALLLSECAKETSETNEHIAEKYLKGKERRREAEIIRQTKVTQKLRRQNMMVVCSTWHHYDGRQGKAGVLVCLKLLTGDSMKLNK